MCPEATEDGTCIMMDVAVAELTVAGDRLSLTTSLIVLGSNPVPVIVTAAPDSPLLGLKLVMIGPPDPLVTVNGLPLVALPPGEVTVTVPEMAAAGTVTISWVAVAPVTVAAVPLKETAFWAGLVLNPVPLTVTLVPTGPLVGDIAMMEVCEDAFREIASRLPTASYW
jgi:hypothetical protein